MFRWQRFAIAGGFAIVVSLLTFALESTFSCGPGLGDCAIPWFYPLLGPTSLFLGLVLLAIAFSLYLNDRIWKKSESREC